MADPSYITTDRVTAPIEWCSLYICFDWHNVCSDIRGIGG